MAVKCKKNNLKSTIPLVPNCADFWNCTALIHVLHWHTCIEHTCITLAFSCS